MLIDYGLSLSSEYVNIGIDIFPDILGYILMFLALKKLSPYSVGFKNAKYMSIFMMFLGGVTFALPLAALFGKGLGIISSAISYCMFIRDMAVFVFNIFVFVGIRELAKDVELPKTARYATAAMVLSALYFVPRVSIFIVSFTEAQMGFVALFYSIFWYISLLFNLFLSFNCYVHICYEGEEDPDVKETFIEKLLSKLKNHSD